jgi:hypothetical protein
VSSIVAILEALWHVPARAAQGASPADMVTSFAWIVLSVSALLVAVGALIVFTKLAKVLDRLESRLRRK